MSFDHITSSRSVRLLVTCFLAIAPAQLLACKPNEIVKIANSYAWPQPPQTYDQMVFWGMDSACGSRSQWCACFAKHVWERAFVFYGHLLDARAFSFVEYGFLNGTLRQSNPRPGDAVIFNVNVNGNTNWADHVAIVTEVFGGGAFQYVGGNQTANNATGAGVTSVRYDPQTTSWNPAGTWFASPSWD